MRRVLLLVLGVAGCAAPGKITTEGADDAAVDASPDVVVIDVAFSNDANAQCGDGQVVSDAGQCMACSDITLHIATQEACALTISNGFTMDGEGFITVANQQERVFAMDRWGAGHIIAWCDSTTMPDLLASFDARGYLGQVPNARVASFGDAYLCNPQFYATLPTWIQYLGKDLPAQYQGNAAGLAADWDAIIFCGFRIPWTTDWTNEIGEFVSQHGKGFLAAMDYEGTVSPQDFANMNKITTPAGIQFDPLNLPWAPATLDATLKCVPDVPPVN